MNVMIEVVTLTDRERYEIMLKNCGKALKEISCDSGENASRYMTESQSIVVDFDDFKKKFFTKFQKDNLDLPASCDALCMIEGDVWYMIEFKNGTLGRTISRDVCRKVLDSLLLFMMHFEKDMRFIRDHVHIIVVYNEEKNPRKYIANSLEKSPKGRGCILPNYLAEVYCQSVSEYTEIQFAEHFLGKHGL